MGFRRALFLLHRHLGRLFGLLWLTVGISGALLVFQEALDAARFLPQIGLYGEPRLTPEEAFAAAFRRHPRPQGSFILFLPRYGFEPYRIQFLSTDLLAETAEPIVLWVDPLNGSILGEEPLSRMPVGGVVYRLHARFGLGDGAKPLVSLSGVLLLLTALIGFQIALPAGLRFRRLNAATLHRLAGQLAFPLLLFSSLTGIYLALPRHWLPGLYPSLPTPKPPPIRTSGKALPLDLLRAQAEKLAAGCRLRRIELPPPDPVSPVRFDFACPDLPDSPRGWTQLWIDPYRGALLARWEPHGGDLLARYALFSYDLHNGRFFGPWGRGGAALSGLVVALLAGTGLWRWLRRRR